MAYKSKEQEREHARAYYQAHKEEMKAKFREYDKIHKEERSAYNKAYREANKERLQEYQKEYYKKNRKKALEQKKEYYIANRTEILQYKSNYWKRKRKYTSKKYEYWKIYIESGREVRCNICGGEEDLAIHHKDRNHYNNDINNLQCLCRSCHTTVHNKLRALDRQMRRIEDENTE